MSVLRLTCRSIGVVWWVNLGKIYFYGWIFEYEMGGIPSWKRYLFSWISIPFMGAISYLWIWITDGLPGNIYDARNSKFVAWMPQYYFIGKKNPSYPKPTHLQNVFPPRTHANSPDPQKHEGAVEPIPLLHTRPLRLRAL